MRKIFVVLTLGIALLFCNVALSFTREFNFEGQFSCGDVFDTENVAGTYYEIFAPSSDATTVLYEDGGKLKIRLESAGDFYIVAHMPEGKEYAYHLSVSGQKDNSVTEQQPQSGNFSEGVLMLVNKERAKVGAPPLRFTEDLQQESNIRAWELTQVFSHTRPDGSDCFTVMKNRGRTYGENIAAGQQNPEAVMDSWMNSPGHRQNILNPAFRELGVGYVYDKNAGYGHYWVQLFRG